MRRRITSDWAHNGATKRAVAPGESTRGVEYKERGGMWESEMVDMRECMGGCYGVASERR